MTRFYSQAERDADEDARCYACRLDYWDWLAGVCRNPDCPSHAAVGEDAP